MGGLLGGKTASTSVTRYQGIQVQSSVAGTPIPMGWGTFRCSCNLLWYGGFKSQAIKQKTGGKGGGGQVTGYNYSASIILGICAGTIAGIRTVYKDETALSGVAAAGLTLFLGSLGQAHWSYLDAFPDQAIGYSGIAYVAAPNYALSTSATLPNHSFEVQTITQGPGFDDANPMDIVTQFLAAVPYWQTAWQADYTPYHDYCRATGLLLSPVIDSQRAASDFLTEILQATNSDAVWSEGLLKIVPYADAAVTGNGAAYTPDLAPVYNLDNSALIPKEEGGDPVLVSISKDDDAWNYIQVEYLDRAQQYNTQVVPGTDPASIDEWGKRVNTSPYSLHSICSRDVATKAAQLIVQRTAYLRRTFQFSLPWNYCLLDPMDVVSITSGDLDSVLVRITEISENDDGLLDITAEEMLVGTASPPRISRQEPGGYAGNYEAAPGSVQTPVIVNPPLALTGGEYELWIGVAGGANWGGCEVWASWDGTTYSPVGVIDAPARYGTTTSPLSVITVGPADPDDVNSFGVDLSISNGTLDGASSTAADNHVTLALVGSEVIAYSAATLTSANQYTLGTHLRRGLMGTTAAAQPAGSTFLRLDSTVFAFGYRKDQIGKTVTLKFRSFNVFQQAYQDISDPLVIAYTVTLTPSTAAFTVVDWAHIADSDPNHPKAADGATVNPAGVGINANDSFETFFNGTFPGWVGGGAVTQVTSTTARRGQKSARLSGGNASLISVSVPATPGETLYLDAGWRTTANDSAGANQSLGAGWLIGIAYSGPTGSVIATRFIGGNGYNKAADGAQARIASDIVPAGAAFACVAIYFENGDGPSNAVGEVDWATLYRAQPGATVGADINAVNLYDGGSGAPTAPLSRGAVLTSLGTAAAITGQGALATLSSADYATQVGGTKPDLYATQSDNLIMNATITDGPGGMNFWIGNATRTTSVTANGDPGLYHFYNSSGGNQSVAQPSRPIGEVRTFYLSFMAKNAVAGVQWSSAVMCYAANASTFLGYAILFNDFGVGTTWSRREASGTAPAGTAYFQLNMTIPSGARVGAIRLAPTQAAATVGADINAVNLYDGGSGSPSAPLSRGAVLTSLGTAAAISGQGLLATKNSASLDSDVLDGTTYKRYAATEQTKLAGVQAGADVTSSHTAAAISGQGSLATANSVDLATTQVTNKSLANLDATANTKLGGIAAGATVGADINAVNLYDGGSAAPAMALSRGVILTSLGTAAAIIGQGSLATANSADYGSQVTGIKPDAYAVNDDNLVPNNALVVDSSTWTFVGNAGRYAPGSVGDPSRAYIRATGGGGNAYVRGNSQIPIYGGQTLFFSGWLRSDNVGNPFQQSLVCYAADGSSIVYNGGGTILYPAVAGTWQFFKFQFTPPANAAFISINYALATNVGGTYMDLALPRVSRSELAADVTATNPKVQSSSYYASPDDNLVPNGDFSDPTGGTNNWSFDTPAKAIVTAGANGDPASFFLRMTLDCGGVHARNNGVIPVQNGKPLYLDWWMRSNDAAQPLAVNFAYYKANGTTLSTSGIYFVSAPFYGSPANTWIHQNFTIGPIPSDTAFVRFYLQSYGWPAGVNVDVTKFRLSQTQLSATVGADINATNLYDGGSGSPTTPLSRGAVLTTLGTAAAITGQGSLATKSTVTYGTGDVTGFGSLAARSTARIGAEVYRADGTTVTSEAMLVTSLGTAAAISSQGALATANSVDLATTQVTNKSLANLDATANTKLSGIAMGATVGADISAVNLYDGGSGSPTTALARGTVLTSLGTAAAITGQGLLATKNTASLDSDVADGSTYKRYAATEQTKLAGVQTGADVTSSHTAAAISGQGALATLNSVDPSTSQVKTLGSIPPTTPDSSFSYTSTSSSITITWPTMTIYRADGTTITVGSGSQAFTTGLAAGTSYRAYPYLVDNGGSTAAMQFVTGATGSLSSPAMLYPAGGSAVAAASMAARGNISLNGFTVATAASGTGTGGGTGGGALCFHERALVETERGVICWGELRASDRIAAPAGWAGILELRRCRTALWIGVRVDGGDDEEVIHPGHVFYKAAGDGVRAEELKLGDLLRSAADHREVTGLRLIREEADRIMAELEAPHLYYGGRAKLLSHNPKP